MDSINLLKSIRHYIANDAGMRALLNETTTTAVLGGRLWYKDGIYARKKDTEHKFPHICFKLDTDASQLQGADDNSLFLQMVVTNYVDRDDWIIETHKIADKLNMMFSDKAKNNVCVNLNNIAKNFSPSVTLKVRRVSWVSGSVYDYKEQGTERRHMITCVVKLVVGD